MEADSTNPGPKYELLGSYLGPARLGPQPPRRNGSTRVRVFATGPVTPLLSRATSAASARFLCQSTDLSFDRHPTSTCADATVAVAPRGGGGAWRGALSARWPNVAADFAHGRVRLREGRGRGRGRRRLVMIWRGTYCVVGLVHINTRYYY